MQADQTVTFKSTDAVFVVTGTATAPMPFHIDEVMEGSDGSRVSRFSGETLEQIAARYSREVVVMGWRELVKIREGLMRSEPVEITEEQWTEALEVLPPLSWGRWGGVESFCMSEFYSGNMTNIYAKLNGRYWRFMDDAYLGGDAIAAKVAAAAQAKPVSSTQAD